MVYFGHFIHANGLLDGLVESCPLTYTSNNAPDKRNVLGTVVCGIINGAFNAALLSSGWVPCHPDRNPPAGAASSTRFSTSWTRRCNLEDHLQDYINTPGLTTHEIM
jgi:hypothetical protein